MKPQNKDMSLYTIQKLLLSDNRDDNLLAWEILMKKYGSIGMIQRVFYENKVEIQIFEPKSAGLIYPSNNKYHCAIGYYDKYGGISYKYIER